MPRKNKSHNALKHQQNVGSFRGRLNGGSPAAPRQTGHQTVTHSSSQPHAEKPDAAGQYANKPGTENPVPAESRANIEPAPELTLAYLPGRDHAMLMRGSQTMRITTKEMLGLMFPGIVK